MSLSAYRGQDSAQKLQFVSRYILQLKCVSLEDLLFRTRPGVKSTQVRSVKEPDITDLKLSLSQPLNSLHGAQKYFPFP